MAKPENDGKTESEKQTWSTWEELLLAYAVNRHGIDSWSTIAAEIQKHNSSFRTLTDLDCRHKYNDLKKRFSGEEGESIVESEIDSVPWLEELRKLRVDELRREVERYDLSISSLQLKVKRLEDERETEVSDLEKIEETRENHRESDNIADVPVIEASKSPDLKENNPGTGSENTNVDREIDELVNEGGGDNDEKPDSRRGSCEIKSEREDSVKEGNDSPESKETSDVQSSASLSRKETVEQNQPDNEDQSLTVDKIHIESQPLIHFIEILQSHPIGSHFSRRLESKVQETSEYEKIIRQHLDFEMIRARVEQGYYKSSRSKFFRDLLLLINNARVLYGERSSEFNAVKELNQIIKKQMMSKQPKEESMVTPKEEEMITVSSLKPKVSVPIVACRKRSSLIVKSPGSVTEPSKKNSKSVDEKAVSEEDETYDNDDEEPILSKKMTRGKTPSTSKKVESRNVKTSVNAGHSSKGRSSKDSSETKKNDLEKKGDNTDGGSKKQGAASFLKRMKGLSSSETMKADSSNGKRGAEQRRSNSKTDKVDSRKPHSIQKRASGKKPAIEKGSTAKKNTSTASKRNVRESEASKKEADSSTRLKKRLRRL